MAIYWQRQGDYEKVIPYLHRAAEISPATPSIQADLGAAHAIQGDLETAQTYYQQAIELAPNDPRFTQLLLEFFIQYNISLRETALPLARELVASYPNSPAAFDVMGQVLFRLGDLHTAERYYWQALDKLPQYAPAHLHLGILYRLQNAAVRANYHLQQAIELAPNTVTATHARRLLEK